MAIIQEPVIYKIRNREIGQLWPSAHETFMHAFKELFEASPDAEIMAGFEIVAFRIEEDKTWSIQ